MKYFAYGSNMSLARLRPRVPGAVLCGRGALRCHDLRFHKAGRDGSAKCDAFYTGCDQDVMYGVVYDIDAAEKPALDAAEGLGLGYEEKPVTVVAPDGDNLEAFTYTAASIDKALQPFSWYRHHVLVGAGEAKLPQEYIDDKIAAVAAVDDPDRERDARERGIYRGSP